MLEAWKTDAAGHVTWHSARSDTASAADADVTRYDYNASGQLVRQYGVSASGQGEPGVPLQDLSYRYEAGTGRLVGIDDKALKQTTTYSYDRDGNRVGEKVWLTDAKRAVQDQVMVYDGFNRLADIFANVKGADYHVHYDYDDNGNRKQERTSYTNDAGDYKQIRADYDYDAMNRETRVSGQSHTDLGTPKEIHPVQPGNQPGNKRRDPDKDEVIYKTFDNKAITAHTIEYDWRGNRISDETAQGKETYGYDLAGRLSTIVNANGTSQRRYDAAGRTAYASDAGNNEVRLSRYDAGGRMLRQIITGTDGKARETVDYNGYDEHNNAKGYTVTMVAAKVGQTTTNSYRYAGGGYRLDTTKVQNDGTTEAKVSKQHYDANGNLSRVEQFDDPSLIKKTVDDITLVSDAAGHVLEKTQGGEITRSLFANDELIGSSSYKFESFSGVYEAVTAPALSAQPSVYVVQSDTETLTSVAQAMWGDERLWHVIAEANGGISAQLQAGQQLVIPQRVNTILNGYQSFTPYNKADAVGDTVPKLDMPQPQGGGGGGCGGLGKLIMVAVAVAATIYTAGAYAVAYAGASTTAGALSAATTGFLDTMAAGASAMAGGMEVAGVTATAITAGVGAVAGAVGSLASQAVGNMLGMQSGFDWRGVAMGAIAGGVSAGLTPAAPLASQATAQVTGAARYMELAERAALGNAITQDIGIVTGLQDGFNWRTVAASYGGAYASAMTANAMQSAMSKGDGVLATIFGKSNELAVRTVSGFAAGTTASILSGGRMNVAKIATDAFGNALGSSLADNFNNDGRLLAPRPVNYSTSIGPVTFDAPQVDTSALIDSISSPLGQDGDAIAASMSNTMQVGEEPGEAMQRVVITGSRTQKDGPLYLDQSEVDRENYLLGERINTEKRSNSVGEHIILAGTNYHDVRAGNKLMFLEEAVRDANSQAGASGITSILYFKDGYNEAEQNALSDAVGKIRTSNYGDNYAVRVIPVNTMSDVENYFNSDRTVSYSNGPSSALKVDSVSIYAHGLPGEIAFGYQGPNEAAQTLNAAEALKFNSSDFRSDAAVTSYACRTGIAPLDGTNYGWRQALSDGSEFIHASSSLDTAHSFAQNIANAWGVTVQAAQTRTDYSNIYDGATTTYHRSDSMIPDSSVTSMYDLASDWLKGSSKYGAAYWNPLGAINSPVAGATPSTNPKGFYIYSPQTGKR